jgi:Domain of unknown function (DUF222)
MPAATPDPAEEQPPGDAPGRGAREQPGNAPMPDDQPVSGASGTQADEPAGQTGSGPGWAWAEGNPGTGTAPGSGRPGPQPGSCGPDGLDYGALVEALGAAGALGGEGDDQDVEFAEWQAAEAEGRLLEADPVQLAAVAVEHMPPGAAAGGWLEVAAAGLDRLDENGLAGVMIAAHQAAARAQATGLAAAARICSQAAAADPRIGTAADGRPARVCRDAVGQIALALRLTAYQADDWADLAVTLAWRLPATRRALADGLIDLSRARLIAQATSVLTEAQARRVEREILPAAAGLTRTQLLERLARAVIAADPAGAERRREQAERQATVSLYTDPDGTATLMGAKLPAVHAAAAMARITAIARAMKAAEKTGGLDLHRARVMLGLLLGTLPYIPPPDGAPPDQPPPPGNDPGPQDNPDGGRGEGSPAGGCGKDSGEGGPGEDPGPEPGEGSPAGGGLADDPEPGHGPGDSAGEDAAGNDESARGEGGPGGGADGPGDSENAPGEEGRGNGPDTDPGDAACGAGPGHRGDGSWGEGGWDDLPAPRDQDAPPDDGLDDLPDPGLGPDPGGDDDDRYLAGPAPAWPALGAIPQGLARPAGPVDGRPAPGLLDAVVPWATLAGFADRSGTLGRIGPITAAQARLLARAAEHDPAAQWRVIVTNPAGQAIAVTRIRRPRPRVRPGRGTSPARDGPQQAGLVGRLTVTITDDTIAAAGYAAGPGPPARSGPGAGPPGGIADAALRAAARALQEARAQEAADAAAGGCAHAGQSPGYRPQPQLREYIIARDVTCRSPVCRQPAWRADLDHTRPYGQHGRTCRCNLGGGCRRDHQLKQHPRWKLEQTRPGHFTWTTPAGRTYTVGPDTYPV